MKAILKFIKNTFLLIILSALGLGVFLLSVDADPEKKEITQTIEYDTERFN